MKDEGRERGEPVSSFILHPSPFRPHPLARRAPVDARSRDIFLAYETELSGYPASLPREFQKALEDVSPLLRADHDLRPWAEDGVALARQSLRSWEASAEYFRVSAAVLGRLPYNAFRQW